VEEEETRIRLKMTLGSVWIERSKIERIEREPSPAEVYRERRGKLDAADGPGWLELGRFCARKGLVSDQIGTETGLSVSLFPMVIISMVIERMSIVWEERGAATSIREGVGSLAIAALAYLIMSADLLSYWVTVFPEINLVVLGLIIALGRYTGFRLTELSRFRQLAKPSEPQ